MILEDILTDVNKKITFKILAFIILSLPVFQFTIQLQNILLSLWHQNFTCQFNSNSTRFIISEDQCWIKLNDSTNVKCMQWNFSHSPVGITMISDFSLVCDYKQYGDIILISWYSTSLLVVVMGWFSDKYGRKKVALLNLCLETVASLCLAFTPNVGTNIFLRICMGISTSGFMNCYVWLMEIVDTEFRQFAGSFIWFYGSVAYMVFPLIAYLSKNWRITQLFSLIPNILYLTILFIPESPRWSLVMNRKYELISSLKKITRINKIEFKLLYHEIQVEEIDRKQSILKELINTIYIYRTTVSFLCIFSSNLLYASIAMNLSILSNNIYISMFLLGLMEIPGLFLSYFSLRYMKRKQSFVIVGLTGSILILLSILFSRTIVWQSIIRIILGCLAKIAITSCNQSILVYVSELCPTTHRSFGFTTVQIANFFSFVAAIYINKLENIYSFLPMLIYFVLMCTTCIIMFIILPETKNLPIPETFMDMKMLTRGNEEIFLEYMNNKNNLITSNDPDLKSIDNDSSNEEMYLIDRKKT